MGNKHAPRTVTKNNNVNLSTISNIFLRVPNQCILCNYTKRVFAGLSIIKPNNIIVKKFHAPCFQSTLKLPDAAVRVIEVTHLI